MASWLALMVIVVVVVVVPSSADMPTTSGSRAPSQSLDFPPVVGSHCFIIALHSVEFLAANLTAARLQ